MTKTDVNKLAEKLHEAQLAVPVRSKWVHGKTDKLYVVSSHSIRESDTEMLVIYISMGTGMPWSRPVTEFLDGRFKRIG